MIGTFFLLNTNIVDIKTSVEVEKQAIQRAKRASSGL